MIKFLFLSLLCFGSISAKVVQNVDGNKFSLTIEIDGNDCCDCGCDDEESEEDLCLNTENSQKIGEALLYVIHENGYTYDVMDDTRTIKFMSNAMSYKEWAKYIKANKALSKTYTGFKELRALVKKYKVCKKVCKVYAELRKALRLNSANATVSVDDITSETKELKVEGPLIIINDIIDDLQKKLTEQPTITKASFTGKTIIINDNFYQEFWHGLHVVFTADVVVIPNDSYLDLTANIGLSISRASRAVKINFSLFFQTQMEVPWNQADFLSSTLEHTIKTKMFSRCLQILFLFELLKGLTKKSLKLENL